MESHQVVQGVNVPRLLYGTAWKENETERLTLLALKQGFRGIDTANQRRHYFEAAVGQGLGRGLNELGLRRADVFVQTKFTYRNGQDHRLPYDPAASIASQVEQSFASSLEHLGVSSLDAYVLHGPSTFPGLGDADWEAWRAMEALQRAGKTRLIGVSNVIAPQLAELLEKSSIKPAIVQNRCFTRPAADRDVRALCLEHGLAYEGFSLLTGNPMMVRAPATHAIARRLGVTVPQVIFRYCLEVGMVVLTGTTSAEHMAEDLAWPSVVLSKDDLQALERLVG